MSPNDEDLEEKKLLGSGGYAIARLTEAEEMKVNLGVHHLFLGNIGRLAEDRFLRYYCNKCEMEHDGCPLIIYEVPNEEIAENVILIEKENTSVGVAIIPLHSILSFKICFSDRNRENRTEYVM